MNLGVLISGRGSNLDAILTAVSEGRLSAPVRVVLSNRPAAAGLDRARAAGIPAVVVDHREFPSRDAFERVVVASLREHSVDMVALAGFDRLIGREFLAAFSHRVLNIHPALLPAFPGMHAQRQALAHGVRIAGATVHFVDEEMDHGPIVAQACVPVLDDDTEETLAARILREEHRIFPAALDLLARGRLRLDGRRVIGGLTWIAR